MPGIAKLSMDIKRLSRFRVGGERSRGASKAPPADLPLDHQLTFHAAPDERWSYRGGRVYINEEDVDGLVMSNSRDIGFLMGLSVGLEQYKQFVWLRGGHAKFSGAIGALQQKVVGRLGALYDAIVGGVEYEFVEDALWLNNINVQAVIALYRARPTTPARAYLQGLRYKLFLISTRQGSNPRPNGIHSIIARFIDEIDGALEVHPPTDTPRLVAHNRRECERSD